MSNEDKSSFRRKPRKAIEDSKEQRDSNKVLNNNTSELSNIGGKIDDLQASTELGNESSEQKNNNIISSLGNINSGIQDTIASGELNAELSQSILETTSTISNVATQISDKLSKLNNMLAEKIGLSGSEKSTSQYDTSLSIIAESIPKIEKSNYDIRDAINGLRLPDDKDPGDDVFPEEDRDLPVPVPLPVPSPRENEDQNDNNPKDKDDISGKLDHLIDATKGGFKASLGFSDKITSMLFKYTVTAMLEAAKTAAMILSIIVALDVIRIHFNYWSKLLETNFDEFNNKAREWGPLLQGIIDTVNDVKNMWEKGDFAGLTVAIIKGIGKTLYQLGELIILGISKAVASVFRMMGADDKADALVGDSLESFQSRTNAQLSDHDQQLLAEYQVKKIKKEKEEREKPMSQTTAAANIRAGGIMPQKQEKPIPASPIDGLGEKDQVAVMKANNETSASMRRFETYLSNADPESNGDKSNINKTFKNIQENIKNPVFDKSPEIKTMLQKNLDDLTSKYNDFNKKTLAVKPEPVSESQDSQSVNRIKQSSESNNTDSPKAGNTTVNQMNQVNNTSKTSYIMPPQTSSAAPGMSGQTLKIN